MPIVLIGFLALFLELTLIRWMPANIFALAYFSNTVLIASFLGLGLGFLLASKKRDLFPLFPLCILMVVAFSVLFRFIFVFMLPAQDDVLWNFLYVNNWLQAISIRIDMWAMLVTAFVLSAIPFVFIGQKASALMAEVKPLKAYGLNVLGGLLGVCAFALLSFAGAKWGNPTVWFAVVGLVALVFLRSKRLFLVLGVACVVATFSLFQVLPDKENWSPYYAINVIRDELANGARVFVNRFLHQTAYNVVSNEWIRENFGLPYAMKSPKKVLVLGAGSGNDVAVALQHGVEEVQAVELDPVIAQIGRDLHPNRPYDDPRAQLIIGDARSFLQRTDETYDMIVFGTLDSHALVSGMSTIRMESFVYTVESFQEAKKHLAPDGVVVIMYSVPQQWLADRIIKTTLTVFEQPDILVFGGDSEFVFNLMILAGPGVNGIPTEQFSSLGFQQVSESLVDDRDVPTDDWPYLYLLTRSIPVHYLKAILLLLLLSLIGIYAVSEKNIKQWGRWEHLNFFSLGAAFLLLETKSVTSLALLFGSTWLVNAFVFSGILLMILFANICVLKTASQRVWPLYLGLGISLALNYAIPVSAYLVLPDGFRYAMPVLLASLPLFFAALVFSFHAKDVKDVGAVLGVNIMGAVFGGFLEYTSMLTGLRFLYVLAAVLYLISFFAWRQSKKSNL